jgi:hypothetical protein
MIALGKAALDTADKTGKLAASVGGTVEEVSGLTLAFRQNQSSQEGLQTALFKTTNIMGQVAAGSQEAKDNLAAIGVDIAKFGNLSAPRALEEIARKLAAIPNAADRAAAAQRIFGRGAGELTTALKAVGEQGIDAFIAKAKELGVLIDADLADAAARANDSLQTIGLQAEGVATQFLSGLAPAVADSMETITGATTGATNGFKVLGQAIGIVIKTVTFLFVSVGRTIGAVTAKVVSFVSAIIDAGKAIAKGDFEGAAAAFERSARERAEIDLAAAEDIRGAFDKLTTDEPPKKSATPLGVDPNFALDAARKAAAAQRAASKQAFDDELKLQQEHLKTLNQENQNAYDQGLISLQQFFARRRELQERENAVELQALKAQRAALVSQLNSSSTEGGPEDEADRIKLRQQLAQLDAQIARQRVASARELAQIDADEAAARKELGQQQLELQTKLADLEGNRHQAFQNNLELELEQIRELGIRAGQTAAEIEATVNRVRALSEQAFNFDELQRQGSDALEAFQRDQEQIRNDVELGLRSQAEGERAILDLEQQRLELLQQLAQAMLAAAEASGNEEQIKKAREFAASVDQIALSYKAATDFATQFRNAGIDAFQSGLEDFLANADKIEDIGDAFKSLARSVVDSLRRMVAEIIAQQATLALVRTLFSAFGGGAGGATQAGSGLTGVGAGLAQYGGRIRGYVGGGDVAGPRLPIPGPDKIPILAQEGEFVLRKARLMEPGALNFMRAWNAGRLRLRDVMRAPRFATGGQVGPPVSTPAGAQASGTQGLRIVNRVDENLVADGINSASGERAIMNVISKNSVTLKRLLGGR